MKCFNTDCVHNDGFNGCNELLTLTLDAEGFCTATEYHYTPPPQEDDQNEQH